MFTNMASPISDKCDENLGDDLLSEDVAPVRVNTIAHLAKNMDHTPFKLVSGKPEHRSAPAGSEEKATKNFYFSHCDIIKNADFISSTKGLTEVEEIGKPVKPKKLGIRPRLRSGISQDISALLKRVKTINERSKKLEAAKNDGFKITMRNIKPSCDSV
mmetsp:Transcript_22478/g.22277  ORF Transcript_22478/g.22277 Transcript_22478/m.22277 type:complete len:159 (-) Transcript_22478:37-513(-)